MTMGRFLVPGLAFQTILVGLLLEWLWDRRVLAAAAVATTVLIGLLSGWDVHLVPQSIRYAFRFRYFNATRTEAGFWKVQRAMGPGRKEGALALKRISKPGDSLVYGAIGVIGYYSDLFIYDRFGLVTREVALMPRREDEPLRAPGHDLKVSRSFFLKQRPTFVAHARFRGGAPGRKSERSRRRVARVARSALMAKLCS